MRPSIRRLALPSSIGTQSSGLRPVPPALLPPIPLYRRILRAHRKFLPQQMRLLGDEYVKSEFRAHRKTENPVHIIGFLTEWQMYAQQVEGESWKGEKMDRGKIDKMSDQQLGQLYELMNAIREKELAENDPEYEPPTRTLELYKPCQEGMNLLTCPDFTSEQPYGPAVMPRNPGRWAPRGECLKCDYMSYDMRRRRILVWKKTGFRWGAGPGRRDRGIDFASGCCQTM